MKPTLIFVAVLALVAGGFGLVRYARSYSRQAGPLPAQSASPQEVTAKPTGNNPSTLQAAEAEMNQLTVALLAARRDFNAVDQERFNLHMLFKGKKLPKAEYDAAILRVKAMDAKVAPISKKYEDLIEAFNKANARYEALGGKVDFEEKIK